MYKSRPGIDFLRYLIFSIGNRIPKPIRIILLLVVEFLFVYNIYVFVDDSFRGRITPSVSQEDRSERNVNELPIRYRRYFAHQRGE